MREKLPKYLTKFNSAISLIVWLPAWLKIVRTGSANDYALTSLAIILWLQATNLLIAILDKSKNLKFYLLVNTSTVAFTFGMVWWYQH